MYLVKLMQNELRLDNSEQVAQLLQLCSTSLGNKDAGSPFDDDNPCIVKVEVDA